MKDKDTLLDQHERSFVRLFGTALAGYLSAHLEDKPSLKTRMAHISDWISHSGVISGKSHLSLLTASSLHRWNKSPFMSRDVKFGHLQTKMAATATTAGAAQHIDVPPV